MRGYCKKKGTELVITIHIDKESFITYEKLDCSKRRLKCKKVKISSSSV